MNHPPAATFLSQRGITMNKNIHCVSGVFALTFGLGLAALPGTAQAGFFEQLFGAAPQSAPPVLAPSYGYDGPRAFEGAPVPHRAKRKVAVADQKPKLQKPTDLMHDTTLQNGDAVMTKDGLRVYIGDEGAAKHKRDDFEPINAVDGMPKQERNALVAMDTTVNDPLRGALTPDTIASGRSASVASPVSAGHAVVDPRGKTVRYVGP